MDGGRRCCGRCCRAFSHLDIAVHLRAQTEQPTTGPIQVDAINDQFARLNITATSGNDDLSVGASRGEFVVDAPQGIATSTCSVVSQRRVRCPHLRGGYIPVWLYEGDDRLDLNSNHVRGRVDGGSGRDTLIGSKRHNYLFGGTGGDEIRAGAGPDKIYGDEGRDSLYGQRGADVVFALDGRRDRAVNCGRGKADVAYVDRDLDPSPIGCERILHTLPSGRQK